MKPEVQEELQPLFDQCIQDASEVVEAAPEELKERYQEIFQ